MKKNKLALLLLCCSTPILIFCQNRLSFLNTLAIIKEYHPIVKQASLKIDFSKATLLTYSGAFDPVISNNSSQKTFDGKNYYNYNNTELKVPTWYGIELKAGIENNYGQKLIPETTLGKSSYVGISVPLLKDVLIDKRRLDLAQSKTLVTISESEKKLIVNDLFLDGATSYWLWVYAYQKQKLYQEVRLNAEKRVEFVKQSYFSGEKAAIDTIEAELQLQNILNLQSQAFANWIEEQSNLSNFLWDQNNSPYLINETTLPDSSWMSESIENIKIPDLLELIEVANVTHPKLKMLSLKQDFLSIEKKYKTQNLLPNLRVNYNFLNTDYQFDNPINAGLYTNNYKAGVSFSFPLFLRQARGELKQTNIKIDQQRLDIDLTKLEIENKIKKYYAELVTVRNQNIVIKESLLSAKKLFDIELDRYQLGESSLFLVNSRELKWIETVLKSYELKTKFHKTLLALNWAKGSVL